MKPKIFKKLDIRNLFGKNDLGSLKESILFHQEKIQTITPVQSFQTKDPQTLEILEKLIEKNPFISFLGAKNPPQKAKKQFQSLEVTLDMIQNAPLSYQKQNSEYKGNLYMAIGGPAAESSAVMMSLFGNKGRKVKYLTRFFEEANASWSARQLHNRHATALMSDPRLTGHKLLSFFFKRLITQKLSWFNPEKYGKKKLEECLNPDYIKIDCNLLKLTLREVMICLKNEYHWARNLFLYKMKKQTDFEIGRKQSMDSQDIFYFLEKNTGISFTGDFGNRKAISTAITVATTNLEVKEIESDNHELTETAGIQVEKLTEEDLDYFFGDQKKNIFGAWRFIGDSHNLFNDILKNKKIIEENSGHWQDRIELKKIFFDKTETGDKLKVVGVEYMDLRENTLHFEPLSKLFITLGYKSYFKFNSKNTLKVIN